MNQVLCPYCGNAAELIDSKIVYKKRSFGLIWLCRPCDAYVGVHKDQPGYPPLGTLAKYRLRKLRHQCHNLFDPLWRGQTRKMNREDAYGTMMVLMNLTRTEAHIALFDEDQCHKFLNEFQPFLEKMERAKRQRATLRFPLGDLLMESVFNADSTLQVYENV